MTAVLVAFPAAPKVDNEEVEKVSDHRVCCSLEMHRFGLGSRCASGCEMHHNILYSRPVIQMLVQGKYS